MTGEIDASLSIWPLAHHLFLPSTLLVHRMICNSLPLTLRSSRCRMPSQRSVFLLHLRQVTLSLGCTERTRSPGLCAVRVRMEFCVFCLPHILWQLARLQIIQGTVHIPLVLCMRRALLSWLAPCVIGHQVPAPIYRNQVITAAKGPPEDRLYSPSHTVVQHSMDCRSF